MDERKEPLASEIYGDLKHELKFKEHLIWFLVAALLLTNLYHIFQWSRFDTVSVDSQSGPANYVQGENTGGIYFGTSGSTSEAGR